MHARLARYAIEPERISDALETFRAAAREIAEIEGFAGGHVLVDWDEGTVVTMSLWADLNALHNSEVRAASLRSRAARAVDGEVLSVNCYEVPFQFG
jgi:heme-degrading monooxygenase HmoA